MPSEDSAESRLLCKSLPAMKSSVAAFFAGTLRRSAVLTTAELLLASPFLLDWTYV